MIVAGGFGKKLDDLARLLLSLISGFFFNESFLIEFEFTCWFWLNVVVGIEDPGFLKTNLFKE